MVNVTLTANEDLVAKARAYAQARNTTLNQLVRDYLQRLTGQLDPQQAAEEFADGDVDVARIADGSSSIDARPTPGPEARGQHEDVSRHEPDRLRQRLAGS